MKLLLMGCLILLGLGQLFCGMLNYGSNRNKEDVMNMIWQFFSGAVFVMAACGAWYWIK